jgi:hypothetical protein
MGHTCRRYGKTLRLKIGVLGMKGGLILDDKFVLEFCGNTFC